ncbi:hypothetical protein J5N97_012288 [Dioscorea zingiberensis]|uniref:Uncharacterized protein n=1 Tax=Dioscorea zingiberensis TaxID=325984 RepID=A0A9D5CPG5_9LILI|nr:hypothetical protein J5N97_012288 [Dioscorea zingiberensis]
MTTAVATRLPALPSAGERPRHCSIAVVPRRRSVVVAAASAISGFSAGFISGYAVSASLLGKPDFGLLTPPEMAETARLVCAAASKITIIADAGRS